MVIKILKPFYHNPGDYDYTCRGCGYTFSAVTSYKCPRCGKSG